MHGEYKMPGGKLVVMDLALRDGRLADVRLSGDFFLEPDTALPAIDAALEGRPVASDDATLAARAPVPVPQRPFDPWRNVFRLFRRNVGAAPHGACVLFDDSEYPKHS